MSTTLIPDIDFPPVASLDEEEQLDALARGLKRAQGFALFLVCCNQAEKRDSLMEALQQRLPNFTIQKFPVYQNIPHLLDALREGLSKPAPDAVFVYGLEAWMQNGESPEEAPFILNLNAARNHFRKEVPCPMVLWVPQYILAAIARGAPDFFSVQSGAFIFSELPEVQKNIIQNLTPSSMAALAGLPYTEKKQQLYQLITIFSEYEALPTDLRSPEDEVRLLSQIADIYFNLGEFKNAEITVQRVLSVVERYFGGEHLNTAIILNNLAELYSNQGNYNAAESLYQRALSIATRISGSDNPHVARILSNLADLAMNQGDYSTAEHFYQHALTVMEQTLGNEHPETARILDHLASLYNSLGNYPTAEPLFRRAFAIRERIYGNNHLDTATSLNNLAGLHLAQGKYTEAEKCLLSARDILERISGPEHRDTAICLSNLAGLYDILGNYAAAEPLYSRVLTIREKILGSEHPQTLTTIQDLVELYRKMGKTGKARRYALRAERLQRKRNQADKPSNSMLKEEG